MAEDKAILEKIRRATDPVSAPAADANTAVITSAGSLPISGF